MRFYLIETVKKLPDDGREYETHFITAKDYTSAVVIAFRRHVGAERARLMNPKEWTPDWMRNAPSTSSLAVMPVLGAA